MGPTPGDIWRNVIIVCKQSMRPEKDGGGAMRAAEERCVYGKHLPQITGYRCKNIINTYLK